MKLPSVSRSVWKVLRRPVSYTGRRLLGTITGVDTTEPVLALTFDDGPHPEYTPRLLEVLGKYRARATFFCVGKFAARHPEVIRQAAEAGHVVGNHTWDHASFPLLTHHERCEQIRKCAAVLSPYGSRLFRPPYGHQSHASRLDLLQKGYRVVSWTYGSVDWRLSDPEQIVKEILPGIRPGNIIVFHDRIASSLSPLFFNREPSLEAVRLLLERFTEKYRFVTVPDLMRHGRVKCQKWLRPADPSWLNGLIEEENLPGRQYSLAAARHSKSPLITREMKSAGSRTRRSVP